MRVRTKVLIGAALLACTCAAVRSSAQQAAGGLELPPPDGALPIRPTGGRGGLLYTPPEAQARAAAAGPSQANAYWSLAIQSDPADLKVYRDANARLGPPQPGEDRVIFIGDSITENWGPKGDMSRYFPGKPNYIGRGYTSETTLQMLVRFRPDVINLQPRVVVMLAGTNDIAGNTGAVPEATIHDNFISMFDLARANNIKVVLISVLPATRYFWQPDLKPAESIVVLNRWLKDYAEKNGIYYVDAHTAMKDANNGMPAAYSADTVHPNAAGYTLLSKITEESIQKALKGERPASK